MPFFHFLHNAYPAFAVVYIFQMSGELTGNSSTFTGRAFIKAEQFLVHQHHGFDLSGIAFEDLAAGLICNAGHLQADKTVQ